MIRKEGTEIAASYWETSELPVALHTKAKDAFDFGSQATVGLHLKRVGYKISDPDPHNGPFGQYLGLHSDGYVVLVNSMYSTDEPAVEIFDTVEELKKHWQLD